MAVKKNADATEAAETTANEEVTEELTKATEKVNTTPETVKVIYIGPTLPDAQLKTNKIVEGTPEEIKEFLKPIIEAHPLVEKMLVQTGELAEKKDKVKAIGSIYNKYYSDIESSFKAEEQKGEE